MKTFTHLSLLFLIFLTRVAIKPSEGLSPNKNNHSISSTITTNSHLQAATKRSNMSAAGPGYKTTPNATILVTGSSGFVGARLVEMLLERNAKTVICFDIVQPSPSLLQRFKTAASGDDSRFVIYSNDDGNLTSADSVQKAFARHPIDVVYHIAALVGPFYDHDKYMAVNYRGTMHILDACRKYNVPRLVFSSSPSTRFTGKDIEGLREEQMTIPETFLATYAETKAMAEKEVHRANDPDHDFYTISVAPHQVYGPHDPLFLPALLETAGSGKLRVFGKGENKISVCYVDNYCHGLICGADVLEKDSDALAKFYIITVSQINYENLKLLWECAIIVFSKQLFHS